MTRDLVSAKELAGILNVNLFTIYRAEERGEIVNYGFGRTKRYDLNEVLKIDKNVNTKPQEALDKLLNGK